MKKFLGILGAVIAAAAIYFGIMFAPEIKDAFLGNTPEPPTQDVEEHEKEPTGDVVAGVQDSEALRLIKKNKISANGQVLSVTASLSPDWIIDKTVSWSLSWNGSNSEIVSQYVSITPSSDTLTCEVKVLKEFTTQIILTCTAKSNDRTKATCTIDYVGKTFSLKDSGLGDVDLIGEKYSDYTLNDVLTYADDFIDTSLYNLSGGTLQGTIQNVRYSSVKIADKDVDLDNLNITFEQWLVDTFGSIKAGVDATNICNITYVIASDVYYNSSLIKSGVSCTFNVELMTDLGGYGATGITLNDTQLIF